MQLFGLLLPLLDAVAVGIEDDSASLVDDGLKAFARQHLQTATGYPHLLGVVAVGDGHQQGGLLALHDAHRLVDVLALPVVQQMVAKEGDLCLLPRRVVELREWIWRFVGHLLPLNVPVSAERGVNPVEVPLGLLVAVAVLAVLHHLASPEPSPFVDLPEDGVTVLAVAHVVQPYHLFHSLALNGVPSDARANPAHEVVLGESRVYECARHQVLRQFEHLQRWRCRTWWRWCIIEVCHIGFDVIFLSEPADSVGE